MTPHPFQKKVFFSDVLHSANRRGMWSYRNQLFLHFSSVCNVNVLMNGFKSNILNLFAHEFIEPFKRWVRSKPSNIVVFPYNILPFLDLGCSQKILVVLDIIFMNPAYTDFINTYRRKFIISSLYRADFIITISEDVKGQLLTLCPGLKIFVVPCCLRNDFEHARLNATSVINKNKSSETFIIFHFGGTSQSKQTELLLKAVSQLVKSGISVNLRLAAMSSSVAQEWVRALMLTFGIPTTNVTLLPRLSDEQLYNELVTADCHCMPSLSEGFGIPIIEAAYAGCPNILSPINVFSEILGDNALYFDEWTVNALCITLMDVYKNPEKDLKLITEKAKCVAEKYTFELIHKHKFIPLWDEICSEIH